MSPVHCVPKKGGFTIVPNENNELIPTRTIVGHRMCIDFRKLNKETRKDHYPLPFIDQTLERLANHTHFCYLDGYFVFSQIAVHPDDQLKATFISPFGYMLTDACLLVYAMLQLLFKDAWLLFLQIL